MIPRRARFSMTSMIPVLLLGAAVWGCGPMGEYAGLRLGGSESEVPASFDFVGEHPVIQLEAQGAVFPWVVNIWGFGSGPNLYVWGNPESGWVKRTAERPDVRVRVGDRSFELRAERVQDLAERKKVAAAYAEKYGEALTAVFERPATVDDFAMVYRLSKRN